MSLTDHQSAFAGYVLAAMLFPTGRKADKHIEPSQKRGQRSVIPSLSFLFFFLVLSLVSFCPRAGPNQTKTKQRGRGLEGGILGGSPSACPKPCGLCVVLGPLGAARVAESRSSLDEYLLRKFFRYGGDRMSCPTV